MTSSTTRPFDADLIAAKAALRREIRARRANLDQEFRHRANDAIVSDLLTLPALAAAQHVMLYGAAGDEVAVDAAARQLRQRGVATSYPRVAGDALEVIAVTEDTAFDVGFRGIREPIGTPHTAEVLDVVVVPGIAFDHAGRRLGQGKGFYDRLLFSIDATRIAVAFACQVVDAVPADHRDARMDILVTEDGVTHCADMGPQ